MFTLTVGGCAHAVSLPQLKDLDWRVDMVTGSDSVGRMCVPTCLLQFQVGTELNDSTSWVVLIGPFADRGSVFVVGWVGFHGDGGAEQSVSGHHVGWTGTDP